MIRKTIIVLLTITVVLGVELWLESRDGSMINIYGYPYIHTNAPDDTWYLGLYVEDSRLHIQHTQDAGRQTATAKPEVSVGPILGFCYERFYMWGNFYHVTVPMWAVVLALAVHPTIAFIRGPLLRRRRRRKGLCIVCGYDLTGNVSGVCSECGTEIEGA
ncbi:MAG: hypothetical protein JSU63_11770 [Phycisphaerales bacterium]|nr:MAG: hypothetical protein JSU63_11770 [Phycisphaerales bacterium]